MPHMLRAATASTSTASANLVYARLAVRDLRLKRPTQSSVLIGADNGRIGSEDEQRACPLP